MFYVALTLFLLVTFLWGVNKFLKNQPAYKAALKLPGGHMYPILGNGVEVLALNQEQTFRYLRKLARKYKASNRLWIAGKLHYNAVRAKDLEVVMTSTKYITKADIYKFLHPFLGSGVLTSTGSKWFQRRRILTPAFHFNILQDFHQVFKEESHKFVDGIAKNEHKNEATELQQVIPRFTLNSICETAMGVKLDSLNEPDRYRTNIMKMGEWLVWRAVNIWFHIDFVYKISGLSRILNKYIDIVHDFSWSVIDRRRDAYNKGLLTPDIPSVNGNGNTDDNENIYFHSKKKRQAMLDTLLAAELNDRQINEEGVREEVDTFMFEGYDTTSMGLIFSLFMLSLHSNWQKLVYDEIIDTLGNRKEDELSIHEYNEMKLLNRVIKETLRLYPPVPFMGRELIEPVEINGVELPIGSQIFVHTYDLHRDPDQFPDPEKFDPDRFLPENIEKLHPLAYIPFSAGPRNCIGQKFAMLEMQTLIANVLLNYELKAVTKREDVVLIADIILRAKTPININFIPRRLIKKVALSQ